MSTQRCLTGYWTPVLIANDRLRSPAAVNVWATRRLLPIDDSGWLRSADAVQRLWRLTRCTLLGEGWSEEACHHRLMTTAGGPHAANASQGSTVCSTNPRRGKVFRRITIAAAVGSTLFGSLWVLRSSGTLVPVAGSLSSMAIAYLGGIAWVAAAICLAVAPSWWQVGSAPFRRFWWITHPWVTAATTAAFTVGTAPVATDAERLLGAAAAVPVLLLVVALLRAARPGPTDPTSAPISGPRLSPAGLLLACLGVATALVVTIACSFAFSLATPSCSSP